MGAKKGKKGDPAPDEDPVDVEDGQGSVASNKSDIIRDDNVELDLDPEVFVFAIVFKKSAGEDDYEEFGHKLVKAGIKVVRREHVYILGFSKALCTLSAEVLELKLQVKEKFTGDAGLKYGFKLFADEIEDQFKVYKTGRFDDDDKPCTSIFSPSSKGRLIYEMVEKAVSRRKLYLKSGVVETCFLLHDEPLKSAVDKSVYKICRLFWPLTIPIQDIRGYYGEKVALYFAFLTFYTQWLGIIVLLGSFVFVTSKVAIIAETIAPDSPPNVFVTMLTIGFILVIILWSTLFLEFWVRRRNELSYQWGCMDARESGKTRVEFKGVLKTNPISGKMEPVFASWKRNFFLYPVSLLTVASMIVAVLALMVGNIILKGSKVIPIPGISGILSGVTVFVFNKIYYFVARGLTYMENHRTEIEWEDSFIVKTFAFQFINSFAMLYYIAFLKGRMAAVFGSVFAPGTFLGDIDVPCPNDDCQPLLQAQLGNQFTTMIIMGQTLEVVVPYIKMRIKRCLRRKKEHEGEDELDIANTVKMGEYSVFDDYGEMIIQFGYATLFAAAYPLAPLLAFVNNLIEIPGDYWKLSSMSRRPRPQRVQDIGQWLFALKAISYISLFTNVAYMVFSSKLATTRNADWVVRMFAFFVLEHLFLMGKIAATYFIPNTPATVTRAIEIMRQLQIAAERKAHHNQMALLEAKVTTIKSFDLVQKKKPGPGLPPPPHLPPGPSQEKKDQVKAALSEKVPLLGKKK